MSRQRRYFCVSAIALLFGACSYAQTTQAVSPVRSGGNSSAEEWNVTCRRLFEKVMAAAPEERRDLWANGFQELSQAKGLLFNSTLADLDRLIGVLDEGGPLSAAKILGDLQQVCADAASRTALQDRLDACNIRERFKASRIPGKGVKPTPSQLQQLLLKANSLEIRGKGKDASALYERVLAEYSEYKDLVLLARRRLVPLLLKEEPVDLKAVQIQLDVLKEEKGVSDPQVSNFALQLLLCRLGTAPTQERQQLWRQGLREIFMDSLPLSDETFAEIDRLNSVLGNTGPLTSQELLTDLVLLAPDISSMRRLQWRRIAVFTGQGDWQNAERAAKLDVALAGFTLEGPLASMKKCVEIAGKTQAASADEGDLEARSRAEYVQNKTPSSVNESHEAEPVSAEMPLDKALKSLAEAKLANPDPGLSLRQTAFLTLFAGDLDASLKNLHTALITCSATEKDVLSVLDDLAFVVAVNHGRFRDATAFASWFAAGKEETDQAGKEEDDRRDPALKILIDCEKAHKETTKPNDGLGVNPGSLSFGDVSPSLKAKFAHAWLEKCQYRLIRWGTNALLAKETSWAQTFWAAAINLARNPEESQRWIDRICSQCQESHVDRRQTAELMKGMVDCTEDTVAQRQLWLKAAMLLYEAMGFEECLGAIDEADRLASDPREAQQAKIGLVRALCLIRLGKIDEAAALLGSMGSWPGTEEEHAHALFLAGWIHLQKSEKIEAQNTFRRIIDKYPNSSFIGKVGELLQRLEGM
jgi:tetratricopeptide (TPR) repeat protein